MQAMLLTFLALLAGFEHCAVAMTAQEVNDFNVHQYATVVATNRGYNLVIKKLPPKECTYPGSAGNPCTLYTDPTKVASPKLIDRKNLCKYDLPNGPIGYAKNGAAIFKVFAGKSGAADFSSSDNDVYSKNVFNDCNGHTNTAGVYHYHMQPNWPNSTQCESMPKPDFIGLALDGHPIYSSKLDNPSEWEPDYQCNGYFHRTDPSKYRYVLTEKMFVDEKSFGPTIKCYRSPFAGATCKPSSIPDGSLAGRLLASSHIATGILTLLVLWKLSVYII